MKEIIGITILVVGFGMVGVGDYDEATREHLHYCAMVDTWIKFQGTRGHPNYEERDCSDQSGYAGELRIR